MSINFDSIDIKQDMSMLATYPVDVSVERESSDMPFQPDRPYNDLPPLPLRADVETKVSSRPALPRGPHSRSFACRYGSSQTKRC